MPDEFNPSWPPPKPKTTDATPDPSLPSNSPPPRRSTGAPVPADPPTPTRPLVDTHLPTPASPPPWKRPGAIAAVVVALAVVILVTVVSVVAARSGSGSTIAASSVKRAPQTTSYPPVRTPAAPITTAAPSTTAADDDPASDLVGTACARYASAVPSGSGSFSGMALDPVITAGSNNPILTTFTAALSGQLNADVNLVDTLNGGQYTVIAPTDDAWAKLDPASIQQLKTDAPLLTRILAYHVIPGRLDPAQVIGTHTTVEGSEIAITGAGMALKFGMSGLVCGGVKTANATVYWVDTVMQPPS